MMMLVLLSNLCIQRVTSTGDSDVNMLIEFCSPMWAHLHVSNLRIPTHKTGGQKWEENGIETTSYVL